MRNYRIGWGEIGWDIEPMEAHFREMLGAIPEADPDAILSQTARQLASPFTYFDAIVCLNFDGDAERFDERQQQLRLLDIAWRVEQRPVTPTSENHHRRCVASWRDLVELAEHRGYAHVLGFEGEIALAADQARSAGEAIAGLTGTPWDICLLGPRVREKGRSRVTTRSRCTVGPSPGCFPTCRHRHRSLMPGSASTTRSAGTCSGACGTEPSEWWAMPGRREFQRYCAQHRGR